MATSSLAGVTSQPGWHPDPVPPAARAARRSCATGTAPAGPSTPRRAPSGAGAPTRRSSTPRPGVPGPTRRRRLRRGAKPPPPRRTAYRWPAGGSGCWRSSSTRSSSGSSARIIALPVDPRRLRRLQRLVRRRADRPSGQQHDRHRQLQRDLARPLAFIGADQPRPRLLLQRRLPDVEAGDARQARGRAAGPAARAARPDAARHRAAALGGPVRRSALLGLVPFVGGLTGLYSLLDDLWPLWDDKKQAIHDKIAKTNVVRLGPAARSARGRSAME